MVAQVLAGPAYRNDTPRGDKPWLRYQLAKRSHTLPWSSSSADAAKHLCLLLKLLRWVAPNPVVRENVVAKPNYHQARKQRELARKARQQEKLHRRSTRAKVADASAPVEPVEGAAGTLATPSDGQG